MKKTEKIEIRISHEDKERLTELAEREGKTVSEMIRDLASRYVGMNESTRTRSRWGLASLGAAFLCGIIGLSAGLVMRDGDAAQADNPSDTLASGLAITFQTAGGFIESTFDANYVEDTQLAIPMENGDLIINLGFERTAKTDMTLSLQACRMTETSCVPEIKTDYPFRIGQMQTLRGSMKSGGYFEIDIHPARF